MPGMSRTTVGMLAVLALLTGLSFPVMAKEPELDQSPLYILQLQNFAERIDSKKIELLNYTVHSGDSLTSIARKFGITVETLVRLNNIVNPHLIYTGQIIQISTVPGAVHQVKAGETMDSIARLYGVDPGSIISVNRDSSGSQLQRGERVIIPGTQNIPVTVRLEWPVAGGRISSGFGWRDKKFHYGIDLAVPLGCPISAAADGSVSFSGYRGGYGLMIELDHGNGWQTRYAHAGKIYVSTGQQVVSGQRLGEVGLTGNTTGAHLHFEVIHHGSRIDPLQVLP